MRRLQLLLIASVLLVSALSLGDVYLFFLVYLGLLVVAGAWLLTRLGLVGLEAGFSLDRRSGQVGETLTATYTVRNRSLLPKLWLEIHSPTTLPLAIPGRALALGPRQERSWLARTPLLRRGHYRIDPLVVRTGDPLGLFESYATVGGGLTLVVTPAVEPLPRWRLPPALIEGPTARPERTLQVTPLVTGIRPYAPGDAYNRIHWKTSARQQTLQVKEFDLQQTADLWIYLDLDRAAHAGSDDDSTLETAVRATAAIAGRALDEGRAVGLELNGSRRAFLQVDRGQRQRQRILHLLAAVQADGSTPLPELLLGGLSRLRRGMSAMIITPSVDRDWVRAVAGLRRRGVTCMVCLVDPLAHDTLTRARTGERPLPPDLAEAWARDVRAVRHALAEHEIRSWLLVPGEPLGAQIVTTGPLAAVGAA